MGTRVQDETAHISFHDCALAEPHVLFEVNSGTLGLQVLDVTDELEAHDHLQMLGVLDCRRSDAGPEVLQGSLV